MIRITLLLLISASECECTRWKGHAFIVPAPPGLVNSAVGPADPVPQRLRALASRRPCPRRVTPLPPREDSRTAVTTPTGTARTKPTTARTDRWSGSALPRQPIVRQLVFRFHPRNPSGLGKPESPPGVRVAQGARDTRPRTRHLRSTVTLWIFIEQRRVDNEGIVCRGGALSDRWRFVARFPADAGMGEFLRLGSVPGCVPWRSPESPVLLFDEDE